MLYKIINSILFIGLHLCTGGRLYTMNSATEIEIFFENNDNYTKVLLKEDTEKGSLDTLFNSSNNRSIDPYDHPLLLSLKIEMERNNNHQIVLTEEVNKSREELKKIQCYLNTLIYFISNPHNIVWTSIKPFTYTYPTPFNYNFNVATFQRILNQRYAHSTLCTFPLSNYYLERIRIEIKNNLFQRSLLNSYLCTKNLEEIVEISVQKLTDMHRKITEGNLFRQKSYERLEQFWTQLKHSCQLIETKHDTIHQALLNKYSRQLHIKELQWTPFNPNEQTYDELFRLNY